MRSTATKAERLDENYANYNENKISYEQHEQIKKYILTSKI